MYDLKSRLFEYAGSRGITINAMESQVGLCKATIANMGKSLNTVTFAKILNAYPDMDARAILGCVPQTGATTPVMPSISPVERVFDEDWYKSQIEAKDKQIEFLMKLLEKGGNQVSQSINL